MQKDLRIITLCTVNTKKRLHKPLCFPTLVAKASAN